VSEEVDGTADAYASYSYEYQVWHLQSNPCSRVGRKRALYRGNSRLRSLNPERGRFDHQRGSTVGRRTESGRGEGLQNRILRLITRTNVAGSVWDGRNRPLSVDPVVNARTHWISDGSIGIINRPKENFFPKGCEGWIPIPRDVLAEIMKFQPRLRIAKPTISERHFMIGKHRISQIFHSTINEQETPHSSANSSTRTHQSHTHVRLIIGGGCRTF
jgi:hypothetical protein